ncbi:MAG: hypothetical protein ABR518_00415 [Actinomycetota bacterium]
MRSLRILIIVAVLSSLFVAGGPSVANAAPCEPRMFHTYRYDQNDFTFVFAIQLCSAPETIAFAASGSRTTSRFSVGLEGDGFAPCTNGRCVVHFGFEHGPEVARYEGRVLWGSSIPDAMGPVTCFTTRSVTGCRAG